MKERHEEQLAKAVKKAAMTSDVLGVLFLVFRESIRQTNNDKRYWIEKLQLNNSIGEALSDHLKELTDAMADADEEKDREGCKESWRLVLREQQRDLATLAEVTESYRKTTAQLLKQLD